MAARRLPLEDAPTQARRRFIGALYGATSGSARASLPVRTAFVEWRRRESKRPQAAVSWTSVGGQTAYSSLEHQPIVANLGIYPEVSGAGHP